MDRDAALAQLAGVSSGQEQPAGLTVSAGDFVTTDHCAGGDAAGGNQINVEDRQDDGAASSTLNNIFLGANTMLKASSERPGAAAGSSSGRSSPDGQEIQKTSAKLTKPDPQQQQVADTGRTSNLEQSLDQMRREFEAMEDYWQAKLEAERRFHEAQLEQSEAQFKEQEARLKEFELLLMRQEEEYEEFDIGGEPKLTQIEEEEEEEEDETTSGEDEQEEHHRFPSNYVTANVEGHTETQVEIQQLKQLLNELEQQIEIHKKLLEEKEESLEQLTSFSKEQLEQKDVTHRTKVEQLKKTHKHQLEQQLKTHNEQMTQLKRAHHEQLQQLKRSYKEQLQAQKETTKSSQQQLQQAYIQQLQQLEKAHDMQLEKQKKSCERRLELQAKQLREEFEEEKMYKDYLE